MSSRLQESHLEDSHFGFRDKPPSPSFDIERSMLTKYNINSEANKDDRLYDDNISDSDFNGSVAIGEESLQRGETISVTNESRVVAGYDGQTTNSNSRTQITSQNIDQPPSEHCSVVSPHKHAERKKYGLAEEVCDKFRFAPAPGPDILKLRRPPPGKATNFSEQSGFRELSPPSGGATVQINQGRVGDGCTEINIPSRGLNRARSLISQEEDESKIAANIINLKHSGKNKDFIDAGSHQENNRKVGAVHMPLRREASSRPPFEVLETSSKKKELARAAPRYVGGSGTRVGVLEQPNARLLAGPVGKHHFDVESVSSTAHLDRDVLLTREEKLNGAVSIDAVSPMRPEQGNQRDNYAPCMPSKAGAEKAIDPVIRRPEPISDSHKENPLEMLNTMQNLGEKSVIQLQRRVLSASTDRPLLPTNLQPKEFESRCSPQHASRGTANVNLSAFSGNTETPPSSRCRKEGFKTPSTSQVVDILKVMMESEEDNQRVSNAIVEQQGRNITNLVTHISTLQQQAQDLKQRNEEMTGKLSGYKERSAAYKAHMNQVTEGQKALWERGEEIRRMRDDLMAKLEENSQQNLETQRTVQEARDSFSAKVKQSCREASQKLSDQNRTIELLRHDLDNRLLDLQRERGLTERLQKQLDDRAEQRDKIESLLIEHQDKITTQFAGCNNGIIELLETKDHYRRIDECLNLVRSLKDSEPKAPHILKELAGLVEGFSESTENHFQEKEDRDSQLQIVTEQIITELRAHIKNMDSQHGAQTQLNECIGQLRKDNAKLAEQICDRDTRISEMNSQVGGITCELEACRGKLDVTVNELNKYRALSAEVPGLRTQLQDLQEQHEKLKSDVESAHNETKKAKIGLRTREEGSMLLQEHVRELKVALEQAEEKISVFERERLAYIQTCKDEFENQRLQTERDFNQRLEEQKEDHLSLVSGLRRQKADAEEKRSVLESKLEVLQRELNQPQHIHMNLDLERVTKDLRDEIAALQARSCTQDEEAGRFEKDLEKFREHHSSASVELQTIRSLVQKCVEDTNRIGGETATNFEKLKNLTGTLLHKAEEQNQNEIKRLEKELANFQKQAEKNLAIQESILRYLRAKGLIRSGDSIDKFVATIMTKSPVQDFRSDEPGFHVRFDSLKSDSTALIYQETSADEPLPHGFGAGTIDPACLSIDTQYLSQGPVLEHIDQDSKPGYRDCHVPINFKNSSNSKDLQSPKPSNLERSCGQKSPVLYDKHEASILDTQNFPSVTVPHSAAESRFSKQDIAHSLEAAVKGVAHKKAVEILDSKQGNLPAFDQISKQCSPNIARRRDVPISPHRQGNDLILEDVSVPDIHIRKRGTSEGNPTTPEEIRRVSPSESFSDLASILDEDFTTDLASISQLIERDEKLPHSDNRPSHFNSPITAKSENELQLSGISNQSMRSAYKLPKSILKRNPFILPSGKQPPTKQDKHTGDTNKSLKRISPTQRSRSSRYNRVASSNSISKQTQQSRMTPNLQRQVETPVSVNVFSIADSPEVQDPRRNALKRTGSNLGSHVGLKGAKLQRR